MSNEQDEIRRGEPSAQEARPVPRRELPISRGVSSQAGLASINAGRNYPASAPRPGEPGSQTNPEAASREKRVEPTVTILPDGRLMAPAPGESGSRPNPIVVDRAEQTRRRASRVATSEHDTETTSEHATEAELGRAEAFVEGVEAVGAESTVGEAVTSGFVNGAVGQLRARTDVDRRRERMTNWAERIDNQGPGIDGLER